MDTSKGANIFYEPQIREREEKALMLEKAEIKTLNDYWNTYKEEFRQFLKEGSPPKIKPVSKDTIRDYMNALTKFFKKYKIKDWRELRNALIKENMKKNITNGLGKFLTFLSYFEYMSKDEEQTWRKGIVRKETKVRTKKFEEAELDKIKEGYKKAMEKYGEDTALIIKFMFYTGQRLEHALEALKALKKDKKKLKFENNIAHMDIEFVSKGHKRAFVAIMPSWFGKELLRKIDKIKFTTYKAYSKRLQRAGLQAVTIRTWFSNFLFKNDVKESIISFLTGKTPATVLREYYLKLLMHAKEEYSKKVADKFPKLD